jgi:hypothetical protein
VKSSIARFASLLAVLIVTGAPALAGDPPYLKLAQELGTPQLANSVGPSDHSYLQLKFVPDGESGDRYTKLVTISILKVAPTEAETGAAARGVIVRLRDAIRERKATIESFDESPLAPVTLFYAFSGDGVVSKGVVYAPTMGYVTAAQIDARNGGTVSPADVAKLKSLLSSAH